MSDEPLTRYQFGAWLTALAGETVVVTDRSRTPSMAAVWSKDGLDEIPSGVKVVRKHDASGDSLAVRDRDVEGWTKHELRHTASPAISVYNGP